MDFVYAIINFLILAGLIVLFGRKKIAAIFRGRRTRIEKELSEAQAAESFAVPSQGEPIAVPDAERIARATISEIDASCKTELARMHKNAEEYRTELRREMLSKLHDEMVAEIKKDVLEMFRTPDEIAKLRKKESEMIDLILAQIHLTPGDIAYLKAHDVLYVTLRSAYPLPEELVERVCAAAEKMLDAVGGKMSFWVREDENLLGGVALRIGDTIYDCSVAEQIYQLERKMQKDCIDGTESVGDLVRELRADIENMAGLYTYQLGRVLTVSDGICWMDGLADIMYGEVVEFSCGNRGMVLDIQQGRIGCVIYGDYAHIESGSRVRRVGRIASVPVGEVLLGRVVNAVGTAIDGHGQIRTTERRPIECRAPAILERASVCEPLHTGIKAIDALVPIGKGQRELIVGDRQTGKTAIIVDTILNQKDKNVICIYVAIGLKDTTVAAIRKRLEENGAMAYTTIVCAPASESASLQYIAPFSATAMGEYFMYAGRDVLIIYDDLSKHAVAYRELSLLLHRPAGREAYPGDVFYLHSRLLERSAKLSPEMGGGSMTALPVLETLAGDISSYIPTNVISITDGQIFLDNELFYEGQRPAINVGLSVSRVGSAAQTKLMKQVSASLRMRLAQYRELSGFSQFATDIDEETAKALQSGARMMAALRQRQYAPLDNWKQAVLIFAIAQGYADKVAPEEIETYQNRLYPYLEGVAPDVVATLRTGAKMTEEVKAELCAALSDFERDRLWQVLQS